MKSDIKITFGNYNLTRNMDLIEVPDFSLLAMPKTGETAEKTLELKFLMDTNNFVEARDELARGVFQGKEEKLSISIFPNRHWMAKVEKEASYLREMRNKYFVQVNITFNLSSLYAMNDETRIFPAVMKKKGDQDILTATVINDGTVAVPISYRIKNTSDNGYIGVVSQHGTAQIGNVSQHKQSEMLIADKVGDGSFTNNWKDNTGKLTEVFPVFGNWSEMDFWGRGLLHGQYFGGPVKGWHGTSKNRKINKDSLGELGAEHFTLDTRVWFLNTAGNEQGLLQCIVSTDAGERWLGFAIDKGLDGNNAKVRLYNGETYAHIDFDTGANDLVSKDAGDIRIEKFGEKVTFRFKNRTVTYIVKSLEGVKFTNVTLFAGQMEERPYVFVMGFDYLHFQKHFTADPTGIPNSFQMGDQLVIEGDTGNIYHNRTRIADTLGSKWFLAPPGETEIQFFYSDFAKPPEIQAEIKEGWL